jgi:hypothetical protein
MTHLIELTSPFHIMIYAALFVSGAALGIAMGQRRG